MQAFSLVVFDLDGTLALTDHRDHFVRGPVKDWDAFYAACVHDVPCWPVIHLLDMHVAAGHRVEIWTGRRASVRPQTQEWLAVRGINPTRLIRMRPVEDHRPDVDLKRDWLNDARQLDAEPSLVYEDRDRVVRMWRAAGVPCLQVRDGNF